MQLSVDNHRIDHPPEIVDRGIALDTDDPGFGVDHNLANVAAVGIGALTWQIVNALIDADIGTGHRPGIGEGSPHHLYHGQAQIGATHRKPSFLVADIRRRSEEHTSELQSLMRTSYAVFCLKKKKIKQYIY